MSSEILNLFSFLLFLSFLVTVSFVTFMPFNLILTDQNNSAQLPPGTSDLLIPIIAL